MTWEAAQQRIGMSVNYTVEMFIENHSNEWFMSETGISSNYVFLEDIFPTEICSFRVIAENEAGKSLPTMPTLLERHASKINGRQQNNI